MVYTLIFPLQNAVCFIILMYLVPVLFTFYMQVVLKLQKNNSGAKRLKDKFQVPFITCYESTEEEFMFKRTLTLTSTLDGGGCLRARLCRFTAGNDPLPTVLAAGWVPELVLMTAKNVAPTEI